MFIVHVRVIRRIADSDIVWGSGQAGGQQLDPPVARAEPSAAAAHGGLQQALRAARYIIYKSVLYRYNII